MIFRGKKGLSDVITNVLIILLVIVAVGIIAAFVFPLLKGTTNQAGEGVSCLTNEVLVKECEIIQNGANYNLDVLISRGVGKGEITEAKIILEKDDGSNNVTNFASPGSLVEYASLKHSISSANFKPKSASVAVKLFGLNKACDASEKITCKSVKTQVRCLTTTRQVVQSGGSCPNPNACNSNEIERSCIIQPIFSGGNVIGYNAVSQCTTFYVSACSDNPLCNSGGGSVDQTSRVAC